MANISGLTEQVQTAAPFAVPGAAIGLIGAGVMGRGIALNLLEKGHPLAVFDLRHEAVAWLAKHGAKPATSPSDAARDARIVITVLPDGPSVREAVLAADGALAGSLPEAIFIECSTIDPQTTEAVGRGVRAAGRRMVDAAMGGSGTAAAEGELIFMLGASSEDQAAVAPLLAEMGRRTYCCGGPGAGISMKLVTNLLSLSILAADAEALVLGAKAGLEIETMLDIWQETAADNKHLHLTVAQQVLQGDYRPTFRTALAQKDVSLGHDLAAGLGVPLFTLAASQQLYSLALAAGRGEAGNGVIAQVLADLTGVTLRSSPKEVDEHPSDKLV